MAMCGCVGGNWVQMVEAGEVDKAKQWWGHCYFLEWVLFWGFKVRRRGVFSKLFC
jgi:hypothetical protein